MIDEEFDMIVSKNILGQWQDIVNILAEIVDIPAALIMRVRDPDIEVFVSSKSEGNPYHPGDKEHLWGSGLKPQKEEADLKGALAASLKKTGKRKSA